MLSQNSTPFDVTLTARARRVDEAALHELTTTDVDDLAAHMDDLLGTSLELASLYDRWERQSWAVRDLDFSRDREHWAALPDGLRAQFRRTMALFFIGERAVTDTLSPVLHASPHEDERVVLATQLADEARHVVFFHRFFREVVGVDGDLHASLDQMRPDVTAGFRRIFEEELVAATERVRRDPGDVRAWVEAVVAYHLVSEAYLAIYGQRSLLRVLRNVGILPGFRTGFTAVARDESRHVGIGVAGLRRRVREQPELAGIVAQKVTDLLPAAVAAVVVPDVKHPLEDPERVPPELRLDQFEASRAAVRSLARRLAGVGVERAVCDGLESRALDLYEQLWQEYERNHGRPHPARYFQARAAGR